MLFPFIRYECKENIVASNSFKNTDLWKSRQTKKTSMLKLECESVGGWVTS